jgi:hypothetical protein
MQFRLVSNVGENASSSNPGDRERWNELDEHANGAKQRRTREMDKTKERRRSARRRE